MRVEVFANEGDKDYVNAIECGSDEEAEEVASQFRAQGSHVKVGKPAKKESSTPKKKSPAKKTASSTNNEGDKK